ncbi:Pleiotropic drug resistance proteins (PDR1-15), ABC superfamily [Mycena indigotica]|uniref:Pleiotropic drug resistance proteins (PDR1-15), ABC superfamily n=1 Tax=Mycena indigotica TaxID=2126181 RepID=A0A8H6SWG9_9AGAR|nr:Pleiotropic drug resistance proteins (PDR1-15), ABC superfamily [Mycena indigotica]KAF7306405.1 Pleiotropic drug resistance proteins (PDR1-15), ABC superfamily [Mycena indigotica]
MATDDAAAPPSGLILSLLPPKPYSLAITNLTIGAPASKRRVLPFLKGRKRDSEGSLPEPAAIVRSASGTCGAGEMLAIIGGSGSGKTTLLNAVAGRLHGLPILDGSISFTPASEQQRKTAKVSKIIGFVRQNDYLLPHLTVRETLLFSAALRLPKTVEKSAVRQIVEQTIEELGLKECADTVVGGIFRKGISGGERRRLSIGCVLVTMPSVLILDEPTTGLDATTSFVLLQTLSELAKRHSRTIILSLHAPRSDAFSLFDRLMVLSKGDVVYSGRGEDSLAWFEGHGCELRKETNPLDFLIDVTSIDNRSADREEESKTRVAALVQAWKDRDPKDQAPPPFQQVAIAHTISRTSQSHGGLAADEEKDIQARPGIIQQTTILLHRSHLNVYRNLGQIAGFLLQSIGIGVFMGLTYFNLKGNPADIQSLKGASFQFFPGFWYLTQVYWIYKYCNDLIIFDREREDRLYNTFPYIIAEFIATLVPTTIPPTIYAVIFYLLSNMRRDDFAANIFIVVANAICMQWSTQGLALIAASIFRGFPQASMCANALSLFFTLSAGFSLTVVPVWLRWIKWISTTFYSFRVMAITQFKDRTFECEGVTGVALSQCDGNNVLRSLDFSVDTPLIVYFAAEIAIIVVLHLLAGLILQFYKPGGVKHATATGQDHRGKESMMGDMDIPRAKINVEVRNLGFKWISSGLPFGIRRAETKPILNDISTYFPAGEISAILGPSGAGKSTLLQLLANRKLNAGPNAHFETSGELLFNGLPATDDVRHSVAFVEQEDDYHLSALTVRETLRYAAILRLPAKMSKKRKIARAEEVLLMLGLKDCADVLVGGELLKGISGGEKRRLSLAVQMISDPSILVVDEPTSGLDSFIANNVMECLKDIARSGRTVIVSIHQPRSDIFHALDNLLILAKGGNAVFSGKREEAIRIMDSQGYPLPSIWFNPADHLLDLVTVDQRSAQAASSRDRVNNLVTFWKSYREKVDNGDAPKPEGVIESSIVAEGRFTPIYIAFPVVWERMFRNLWRQRDAFWSRLTQTPLAGILLLMFFERLRFGPTAGQDRIGVVLQSTSAIPFVGLIGGIAIFPQDRQLFMHEYRSSAAYSVTTMILAYSLMEVPFQFLAALFYGIFMNVAVGMQTSARIYFEYCVTIWALNSFGESVAIIFASFFDAMGFAVSLVSTVLSMVTQFSGILSLSVPYWLQIIAWGTPLKATQRLQFINECSGLQFHCSESDIARGVCTAVSGEQLLQLYSFDDRNTAKLVGIAVSCAVAWRLLAWAALRARMWRE